MAHDKRDLVALNRETGEVFDTLGMRGVVTNLFDRRGEEIYDPDEAVAFVAEMEDGKFFASRFDAFPKTGEPGAPSRH